MSTKPLRFASPIHELKGGHDGGITVIVDIAVGVGVIVGDPVDVLVGV